MTTRGGPHPSGEAHNRPFPLSFNPRRRIELQSSRVTSDGRLLLVREPDERLRVSDLTPVLFGAILRRPNAVSRPAG
jgi:hypothetical protein